MRVVRWQNPIEFQERVGAYLVQHEAANNLLFGIIGVLQKTPDVPEDAYMAHVEDAQGQVMAVALRTPPRSLVIAEMADPSALVLIVDDAFTMYPSLPSVSGPKEHIAHFAELWSARSGQTYRLHRSLRVYQLEYVTHPDGVNGAIRKGHESDHDLLVRWVIAFQSEALGDVDPDGAVRFVESRLKDEDERGLHVWIDGENVTAMAAAVGPTPNGIRINMVYTPPEYRKHGYASALVAALSQKQLDAGRKFCFLFTDTQNPTSNHIYQTIGYQPVRDVDEYAFEEGTR
jgi:uncharacterized protein